MPQVIIKPVTPAWTAVYNALQKEADFLAETSRLVESNTKVYRNYIERAMDCIHVLDEMLGVKHKSYAHIRTEATRLFGN